MTTIQDTKPTNQVEKYLNDQERQAYIDKQQARLDEWMSEVEKLKAKSNQFSASAREQAFQQIDQQLNTLQGAREVVQGKFSELKEATSDRWNDLVQESEEAFAHLSDQIQAFVKGINDSVDEATPANPAEQNQP